MRSMCSPCSKQYLPDHLYFTQEVQEEIFPEVASKYHGDTLIIENYNVTIIMAVPKAKPKAKCNEVVSLNKHKDTALTNIIAFIKKLSFISFHNLRKLYSKTPKDNTSSMSLEVGETANKQIEKTGGEIVFRIFLICRIELWIKNHELLLTFQKANVPHQHPLTCPWYAMAYAVGQSLPPNHLVWLFPLRSYSA